MDPTELGILEEILIELLTANNELRRSAEVKLDAIWSSNTDLYALGMMQAIADENLKVDAWSLALVLFWRGVSYGNTDVDKNIWRKLSGETKEKIKNAVL